MSVWRDVILVAVGGAIGTAVRAGLTLGVGDGLGPHSCLSSTCSGRS